MRGLQDLGLLAQASDLSEFCRIADKKRFQDDIKWLTSHVQANQLDVVKLLATLTAALVKGLQLYVSTSTSTHNINQEKDAKQNADQEAGSSSGSSKSLLHGQKSSAVTEDVQESLEHLANLAHLLDQKIVPSRGRAVGGTPVVDWMDDVGSCLICHEAGLFKLMPQALRITAAQAEQMRLQLERRVKQHPHTAPRQAARPLIDLLDLGHSLVRVWVKYRRAHTVCTTMPRPEHAKTLAKFKSLAPDILSTYPLSAVAATISAIWSCGAVLRACFTSSNKSCGARKDDSTACWLLQPHAAFAVTAHVVELVAACAEAETTTLCDARPSAAVSAAGCHTFLQVISGLMALYAAHLHTEPEGEQPTAAAPTASGTRTVRSQGPRQGMQDSPASGAPAQHGSAAAVPPHHAAVLQAVGLDITQMQEAIGKLESIMAHEVTSLCCQALSWALHLLLDSMEDPQTAVMQNQAVATLRLLPPLVLVLAELAVLQPTAKVLGSVLRAFSICLVIARSPAAEAQPLSSDSSMSPGAAISQAVLQACLELVPMAAQRCRYEPKPLTEQGAAGGASPAVKASWEFKRLFQQLGDCMAACTAQHGMATAWLPDGMCPGTVFSGLETVVRHNFAAEPVYIPTGVELAVQTLQLVADAVYSNSSALKDCATDSSKAPALLSLLLSCLKRLQHCSGYVDAAANARLACEGIMAAQMAADLIITSTEGSCCKEQVPASLQPQAASQPISTTNASTNSSVLAWHHSSRHASIGSNHSTGADQPMTPVSTQPGATSSMWLLLAGRALYTTGVALQAALSLPDSGLLSDSKLLPTWLCGTQQQPQVLQVPDTISSLPELWLPVLQHCIAQLGSAVQHLAAADGSAAVQGSKQLRVVLGRPVLDAYSQLVAASEAASASASQLAEWRARCHAGDATSAGQGDASDGGGGAAAHQQQVGHAWQQLGSMGNGKVLVDSLLNFSSLLCAALPTRFCCNEPSCCCFDTSTEAQLAVRKGSTCIGCGAARYCGVADHYKHWKQHKPACKAVAAAAVSTAAMAAPAAAGQDQGPRKGKKKGKKQQKGKRA